MRGTESQSFIIVFCSLMKEQYQNKIDEFGELESVQDCLESVPST
jgi:hypothetical protein